MSRSKAIYLTLGISPVLAGGVALLLGSYTTQPGLIAQILYDKLFGAANVPTVTPELAIIWNMRLPRIILAGLVGAALSSAGVTLQGLFRNPLVDPFILGLSAGTAFGCALSVAVLPKLPIQLAAFVFSIIASFTAYGLAFNQGTVSRLALVLSGVVVSAFFTALVSILKFMVDPHKLASIVYWLMGSFALADWKAVTVAAAGIGAGGSVLLLITAASLAVGSAVSVSGIIGWVGLMVPHLVRMLIGPDHRCLMPCSLSAGATFMVFADTLARNLTSFDIPVGIITALSGAPFFIFLMKRGGREHWSP